MIPVSKECLVYEGDSLVKVRHKMPREHRGAHDGARTASKGLDVKEGSYRDVLVEL